MKTKKIQVRVTEPEKNSIIAWSDKNSINLSEWIRKKLLEGIGK